jgi:hypothetical protein
MCIPNVPPHIHGVDLFGGHQDILHKAKVLLKSCCAVRFIHNAFVLSTDVLQLL